MQGGQLRHLALWVACAGALVLPSVATPARQAPAREVTSVEALEAGLLAQINSLRRRHGIGPLRLSRRLAAAAQLHSQSMARGGFFTHESADGSPFSSRVERFYGSEGYRYWSVGENLIWASPTLRPGSVVQAWLDSPKHRQNLLTAAWREIGLSAVRTPGAPGAFRGLDVTIVTADFGVRKR